MKKRLAGISAFLNPTNFLWLTALLALLAVAMTLAATRWGAALSDDSFFYVKPARDILAGLRPVFSSHYPPLLPILVTAIGFSGIEPLQAIRLFNSLCFGLNVLLAGQILWRMTASRGIALAGAVVFMISQVMLEIHSWAMSEPLFILMCLATIFAFGEYAKTLQWRWLIFTALLAGGAALSRYAGMSVIAAGTLTILIYPAARWQQRLKHALAFAAIAAGMFASYILSYSLAFNEWSQYGGLRFRMLSGDELREAFYNLLLWVLPGRLLRGRELVVMAALLGLVLLLLAWFAYRQRAAALTIWKTIWEQPVFLLLAALLAANLFLLYQAHINPFYRSPFDTRLLSPNHAILILLVTGLLGLFWKVSGRVLRLGVVVFFAWIVFLYLPRSVEYVLYMRDHGAGFATPYWAELDAARFINAHPTERMVTTAPMGVYFSTGKEVRGVYELSPDMLRAYLAERDAYLLVFHSMPLDLYGYPNEAYLAGLVQVDAYSDCLIYQAAESANGK